MAGLVRYAIQISGFVGRCQFSGTSLLEQPARCVGPSAWLQAPAAAAPAAPACGARCDVGLLQPGVLVGRVEDVLHETVGARYRRWHGGSRAACSGAPSCPAFRPALRARRPAPRARCATSTHSNAPQPLLTVLPSVTATGRIRQHLAVDLDRLADARVVEKFVAMLRIVAAGTSQIRRRPLGWELQHVHDQVRKRGLGHDVVVHPALVVGADLDGVRHRHAALEQRHDIGVSSKATAASRSGSSHSSGLRLSGSRR